MPIASRVRARRRLSDAARRAHEGARPLRRDDPGRVRRPRPRLHDLRDDRRGALPRLDEPLGRPEHAPDVRLRPQRPSAPTQQKKRYLPAMARGEHRGGALPDRAARRQRHAAHPHHGSPRGRPLRGERLEDVHHQRRAPPRCSTARGKTDPDSRPAAQGHQPARSPRRARASPSARDLDKLGYKGIETCEVDLRGLPRAGRRT